MEVVTTVIPGCLLLRAPVHADERGVFVKTFHRQQFGALGLNTEWPEEFFTVSRQGVLRGLHFQRPPHDHAKMVCCLHGRILDVVVDLRRGSPAFGQHQLFELDTARGESVYLSAGLAHGFLALTDGALVAYRVGSVHAPAYDTGIRWDSAGIPWPAGEKIVSARDRAFPTLAEFDSPFTFEGAA